jgi:branched-chain amino acid transport system permease protein
MSNINQKSLKNFISLLELLGISSILMLALAVLGLKNPYLMRVAILVGINIILVVALNLSNGFTGIFSLGHVGFMAIGAYTSSILTLTVATKSTNLPSLPIWLAHTQFGFLPALLIAGSLAALIALLIGFPLMRLSGNYVAVATLGFLEIVHIVLINWEQFTRGARTFSGVIQYTTLWWVYIWILITIYVVWRIVHSHYGRALLAVRDDPIAAQTMGVSILRSRLLAFVVSAFLSAVGGGLMAHFLTSFSPATFYFTATFNYIIILIIGGLGSISGSVLGATLVTLLTELLRNFEQSIRLYGLSQIILAAALVLIIIFYPKGLIGYREINWLQLLKLGSTKGTNNNSERR